MGNQCYSSFFQEHPKSIKPCKIITLYTFPTSGKQRTFINFLLPIKKKKTCPFSKHVKIRRCVWFIPLGNSLAPYCASGLKIPMALLSDPFLPRTPGCNRLHQDVYIFSLDPKHSPWNLIVGRRPAIRYIPSGKLLKVSFFLNASPIFSAAWTPKLLPSHSNFSRPGGGDRTNDSFAPHCYRRHTLKQRMRCASDFLMI